MVQQLTQADTQHSSPGAAPSPSRLLVFPHHEAWVHQLQSLGMAMDVVTDLPGYDGTGWDEGIRPFPSLARLISLREALSRQTLYTCIILHRISELLECRMRPEPKILVLHTSQQTHPAECGAPQEDAGHQMVLQRYTHHTRTHVVASSEFARDSWGFNSRVVRSGVRAGDYEPHSGHLSRAIRICFGKNRRSFLAGWDPFRSAFADVPICLVGHPSDIPGAHPSRNWRHLCHLLRDHRFYIHTADTQREDGFDWALLEAMAAGLPVIGNPHPTSPVEHGISGFLSNDPQILRTYADRLLLDPDLAYIMGQAARQRVLSYFPMHVFRSDMLTAIAHARCLATATDAYAPSPGQRQTEDLHVPDRVPAGTL